jgi:HEAT repeat protein
MIYFEIVTLAFLGISVILVSYILVYLWIVNAQDRRYKKWKNIVDLLLRDAIFNEANPEEAHFSIPNRTLVLLKRKRFRQLLERELLSAKKNMSGTSAVFLQKLYLQLGLDAYALKHLASKKWHVKAKAIQDLGIMGLEKYFNLIYKETNNKNELVRMEAQIAVIKLTGFEGLRFLDVVSYQINDWQQIKLLSELSLLPAGKFNEIEKWLNSANESVVIFALKLIKNFHRFELYPQAELCLKHPSMHVRHKAIAALEKIYNETTAKVLLDSYRNEVLKNKIAIIKAVQQIGTEEDIPELISFLEAEEAEEKRTIVRAIGNISSKGLLQLRLLPEANQEPLSLIIKQIEGELSK